MVKGIFGKGNANFNFFRRNSASGKLNGTFLSNQLKRENVISQIVPEKLEYLCAWRNYLENPLDRSAKLRLWDAEYTIDLYTNLDKWKK